jgi:AmiR/NasT family two-component response regulator
MRSRVRTATEAIRFATDPRPDLVILTAFSQRELVERARDAGAMWRPAR